MTTFQKRKKYPGWALFFRKHLLIFALSLLICFIFGLAIYGKLIPDGFLTMFLLTFFQIEIFLKLGEKFFQSLKTGQPGKFKKQIVVRLLFFYLTVLAIACLLYVLVFLVNYSIYYPDFSNFFPALLDSEIKDFLFPAGIGFLLGAIFFFYMQWSDTLKREQKLYEEKLVFQYETLKNQVNPHFLFNSLNTLSSLVYDSPEKAEEFIQKLSAIYRYVLEKKEAGLVTVETEMAFVNDFFYLQQVRGKEKIEMSCRIENPQKLSIIPVSVQMLVENALKHNAATREQPLRIEISADEGGYIVVCNNVRKKQNIEESPKTGLKNLNERCRLMLGKEIEVVETPGQFIVKVPVKAI